LREAATEAVKRLQEWAVGLDYREDVYRAVKAYADTNPQLAGEEAKLFTETMRDYRRSGLMLPKPQRDEVEKLRKELAAVSTDFREQYHQGAADAEVHQGGAGRGAGKFAGAHRGSKPAMTNTASRST
jgi:thimet oligopeptidase